MRYLIFGGAGFIGSNLAARLARLGEDVIIADNLSRRGSELNLAWLREHHPSITFKYCDIRHPAEIENLFREYQTFDVIIHLASQVAVTTSVEDPQTDFEINAIGTFNILERIRLAGIDPVFLFSSTNKVYGGMEQIEIIEQDTRYTYVDFPHGIDETCPLDFHSPYGCSKGCADQYVRDYSRIYGLRSVIFRQSAIYGTRQFGVEDQGWVAWFLIAASKNKDITIYGDGKQVRDLLWIDDLADVYLTAIEKIKDIKGQIFNIGGGMDHSISIWREFGPLLCKELDFTPRIAFDDWRPGDQKVCVMNIAKAKTTLSWTPKVSIEEGVSKLAAWVKDNLSIL